MHELTEKYKGDLAIFESFKTKAEVLIKELLLQHTVNFHKIESRTKDPAKLDEKIVRKNSKYTNLNEITDLVGIRIIAYFDDEVDRIASIIKSEFVLDIQNTIDKRKLEMDRFGYKSLHYVVSLSDQRKQLTEYKRFKDIKVEIQIRSILQHAWAEIEHDIGYKGEQIVPESIKRGFFRVAALLETADIEFVNIKNSLSKYEETVTEIIKLNPEEVEINGASLISYISNTKLVNQLDKKIANIWSQSLIDVDLESISTVVNMLRYLTVKTIKELDNYLIENKNYIVPFMNEWAGKDIMTRPTKAGISIFYLCYILIAKKDDIKLSEAYLEFFFSNTRRAQDIIDIYKKVINIKH